MTDVICLSEMENTLRQVGSAPGPSQTKSSSSKRLKQARLPFAVLNQKLTRQPTVVELFAPKKRKLSGEVALTSSKVVKCSNDKGDHSDKTKLQVHDASEEVVSSSTTDVEVVNKEPDFVPPPSEKSKDILKRFLVRKPPPDDVSTSVVDSTLEPKNEVAVLVDKVVAKNEALELEGNKLCTDSSPKSSTLAAEIEMCRNKTSEPVKDAGTQFISTPLSVGDEDSENDSEVVTISDNQSDETSEFENDDQGTTKDTSTDHCADVSVSADNKVEIQTEVKKSMLESSEGKVEDSSSTSILPNDGLPKLTSPEPSKRPADVALMSTNSKKRKLKKETVEEKAKRLEERKRKRLEKEQKLEEQRRLKNEAKIQKEKEKNEALARKKEEQEKKALEKQERLKQKEEEKRKRLEEKEKKKQDETDAKLEEKRKKELDKSLKEDEKLCVNEKSKAAFVSFFVKKDGTQTQMESVPCQGQFKPFEVKDNMRLAPWVRVNITDENLHSLDEHLQKQEQDVLYLHDMQKKTMPTRTWDRTWPPDDPSEVVEVSYEGEVLNTKPKKPRAKLLKFHENVRPPYWGTWRKTSAVITARKPFGQDKLFDYEVDSDDEWEEEEPGESLSGTEDEKESEDEYEVDNEFFVPHGYLSDEENKDEDEECTPPDMQKAKLKMKELEFEEEMKKKTQQIKPKVLGCIWVGDSKPGLEELIKVLEPFRAVMLLPAPIPTSTIEVRNDTNETMPQTPGVGKTPSTGKGVKKQAVPEEAMTDLIKLLHGNKNNRFLLAREFMQFWNPRVQAEATNQETSEVPAPTKLKPRSIISKLQLGKKIKEIAAYQKCPQQDIVRGKCWTVHNDILTKYNLSDLSFSNTWKYVGEQSSNMSNASILFSSPVSFLSVGNTPSVADLLNNPISYSRAVTSSTKKRALILADDANIPEMLTAPTQSKILPVYSDAAIPAFSGMISPIAKCSESIITDSATSKENATDINIGVKTANSSSVPKRIKPVKIGSSITKFFLPSSSSAAGSVDENSPKLTTARKIFPGPNPITIEPSKGTETVAISDPILIELD